MALGVAAGVGNPRRVALLAELWFPPTVAAPSTDGQEVTAAIAVAGAGNIAPTGSILQVSLAVAGALRIGSRGQEQEGKRQEHGDPDAAGSPQRPDGRALAFDEAAGSCFFRAVHALCRTPAAQRLSSQNGRFIGQRI